VPPWNATLVPVVARAHSPFGVAEAAMGPGHEATRRRYRPKRRARCWYVRIARRKSISRKAGQYASQK
jgi:hypothetical protein